MTTHDPRRGVEEAGERTALLAFLARQREAVVAKVDGLDDDLAHQPLVPSGTSVAGLVKHLRWVEYGWLEQLVADGAGTNVRPHDRDGEFRADEPLADLVDAYRAQAARSDEVVSGHALDDTVLLDRRGPVTLRWILLHLVEETSRHLGHLDILCEQLDGRTG